MDRAYLEYRDGYSDKFYRIVVTEVGGDWITTVWWGRRGSDGQTQVKYMGPSKATAQAELAKLYAQKTGKGYVDAVDPVSPA